MDPNTSPMGAAPAPTPAPAPAPEPAAPVAPAPAEPATPTDTAASDLGNLANELNSYDPTAELAAMANNSAQTEADLIAADPASAATPAVADAVNADPTVNPAAVAAPTIGQPSADLTAAATVSAAPNMAAPAEAPMPDPMAAPIPDAMAAPDPMAAPAPDAAAAPAPSPFDNIAPIAPENPPIENTPVSDEINPVVGSPEQPAPVGQPAPEGPLQAAQPVPGSIGSAKSYADIQREEVERAAKAAAAAAAKQNGKKKFNSTTIILAAAAAIIAVIGIIVLIVNLTAGSNSGNQSSNNTPAVEAEPEMSTLICSIDMKPDEYAGMPGVLSARRINTFTFGDDILDGIKTEQIYYMDSANSATAAKDGYDSEHPNTKDSGKLEEPEDDDDSDKKTVSTTGRESMEKISTTASGATYTFTRYVDSDNIEDWVKSEYYSDADYGLTVDDEDDPEASRTIDGFMRAQNEAGFTCTVTKE